MLALRCRASKPSKPGRSLALQRTLRPAWALTRSQSRVGLGAVAEPSTGSASLTLGLWPAGVGEAGRRHREGPAPRPLPRLPSPLQEVRPGWPRKGRGRSRPRPSPRALWHPHRQSPEHKPPAFPRRFPGRSRRPGGGTPELQFWLPLRVLGDLGKSLRLPPRGLVSPPIKWTGGGAGFFGPFPP